MHVISVKALREFWIVHWDAESSLKAWFHEAKAAHWEKPDEIKQRYPSASFLAGNRVIFNIKGNDYRLVVKIHYNTGIVYIRFVGTHDEYNKIDAEKI
jgi:mRNA interferase HigB